MLTISQLKKLAEVKKLEGTVAERMIEKTKSAAGALQHLMPVTKKALDERTEGVLAMLVALEQRVESLEEQSNVATALNHEDLTVRVTELMDALKKGAKKQSVDEAAIESLNEMLEEYLEEDAPAEPVTKPTPTTGKKRATIKFDQIPKYEPHS